VGLPVIVLGASDPTGEIGVLAVLMLAVAVPLINACAVVALEMAKHKLSWSVAPTCLKSVFTNPLIIACAAGGIANWMSKSAGHELLPASLVSFFDLLGQMALPFALLSIGAALRFGEVRGEVKPVLISSLMKTIVAPLVGALVVLLFPVDEVERRILLVFLACPAAAVTFVMVDQIGGSKPVAAGIVLASTVLSFPALFGVLWFLNHS
jgi:predicted permease